MENVKHISAKNWEEEKRGARRGSKCASHPGARVRVTPAPIRTRLAIGAARAKASPRDPAGALIKVDIDTTAGGRRQLVDRVEAPERRLEQREIERTHPAVSGTARRQDAPKPRNPAGAHARSDQAHGRRGESIKVGCAV